MKRLLKFSLLAIVAVTFGVGVRAQDRAAAEMANLRNVHEVEGMPATAGMPASAPMAEAAVSSSARLPEAAEMPALAEMPLAEGSENPVAEARDGRMWEMGPFVTYGRGVGMDRDGFNFLTAGFKLGKPLTPVLHAGILSGQFELGGNIMPLWVAFTPAPHMEYRPCFEPDGTVGSCLAPIGGGNYYGVSITPAIFRWNFLTKWRRVQPWFQGAGGLIYTTHKFPPDVLVSHGIPGGTSVWNFSPQGGIGVHYFTRDRRSIDLGVNAVHISSASLGDRNPGVNASVQIQLDYTFWK